MAKARKREHGQGEGDLNFVSILVLCNNSRICSIKNFLWLLKKTKLAYLICYCDTSGKKFKI